MPETLDAGQPAAPSPLSRRRLIQHAGAAGAATVAAGLALDAALAGPADAAPRPHGAPRPGAPAPVGTTSHPVDEPFVVRIVDARTGELDIFHGHQHHRVRDQKLVAELLRAAAR
ncbi:twin-arginine translocation signal domain-containing protein [Streptacidiphilus melanogenes]|uniref:twin-arginine translocation signal domain-containing protein n=1 Tax=Streptacidiphilus melanogenes TaxID=411235 RepID=UPI0005AA65C2|nr:twin-arginine translocation signal domain-containing protein [Streptacidiphilus melanogenes]